MSVVGHIPVDAFLLAYYTFVAPSKRISFKGQAYLRSLMTAFSFLAVLSTNRLSNSTVTCLGGGFLAICNSRTGANSRIYVMCLLNKTIRIGTDVYHGMKDWCVR